MKNSFLAANFTYFSFEQLEQRREWRRLLSGVPGSILRTCLDDVTYSAERNIAEHLPSLLFSCRQRRQAEGKERFIPHVPTDRLGHRYSA